MTDIAEKVPVAARAPRRGAGGVIGWLRANLFNSIFNSILTVLALALIGLVVPVIVRWALIDAIWSAPNGQACHGSGACWAFIGAKFRFILFGRYPVEEEWRPIAVVVLFVLMILAACVRPLWGRRLAVIWFVGLSAVFLLMLGGVPGLPRVETALWSGLPLTLILAVVGMLLGFPLGVLLALGRRSRLPAVRAICIAYIELVRVGGALAAER